MPVLFVTGTDTEVGKTWVTCRLLRVLRSAGYSAVGFKPVAAGCTYTAQGWQNDDAVLLRAASSPGYSYQDINPIALKEPVAPHIAAQNEGRVLNPEMIVEQAKRLAANTDWVLVEGAGGIRVPLTQTVDFRDLAQRAGWPVLLVVGMRLGCINHAILTAESLENAGLDYAWLPNWLPPLQTEGQANAVTLESRLRGSRIDLDQSNLVETLESLV